MAVIALPSQVWFDKVDNLELTRSGAALRSKYTGKRQQINYPYALWTFDGTLILMDGADATAWRAFLVDLDGQANKFRLPIPGYDGPSSGYSTAHPLAIGLTSGSTAARALSMTTRGWFASSALMKRGDYFTVNDELKMCMADVATDGSGNATISFKPALRKPVTDGMTIEVNKPFIYVASIEDSSGRWGLSKPVQHSMKLKLLEAYE